ncbi:MAG: VWA domain-containing protein [Parvibaculaceae bacterium]
MFRKFPGADSGSVAFTFGVSLLGLVTVTGVAVDYARYTDANAKLQTVVDGSVLAAVRAKSNNAQLSDADLTAIARRYFDANSQLETPLEEFELKKVEGLPAKDEAYSLRIEAQQPTTLMRVVAIEEMTHDVTAQAVIGRATPVEVSLVLDVTGSMTGTRITALKDAANKMVDTLLDAPNSQAKIAIVPFSDYVNVGLANRNKPWINVPADYSVTTNQCTTTKPVTSKKNCRMVTKTGTNDGVPYTYQQEVCDYTYGPPVTTCADKTTKYKWNGCVGSRTYPLNVKDEDYSLEKVPGLLNISCPAAVTELTNNKTNLKKQVKALGASGNTYIPAGLVWGWRSLTSIAPFDTGLTSAEAKQKAAVKAILLMTDGANVRSPKYPKHDGSNVTLANTLLSEACANIKKDGVRIYTIAFEVGDEDTEELLRNCADSPDQYYDASSAEELSEAFSDVADRLASLYLNK